MPLGTRELLLVIRASDQASRVIQGVGSSVGELGGKGALTADQVHRAGTSLLELGTVIAAAGAVGVAFLTSAASAAVNYNKEAALTLTQVTETGVSLQRIKDIGIDVAKAIPAPFEQMQKSLYDIFSSMDVNTLQAQSLLTSFSKAAVAGNVDIQDAGRATIAIMNGFKIPVSDVNHVMDVQFKTVALGVLTYDEYATTIGRAIPSAQKAGQSIESLSGMIAFLTRNGLSAAMASTSAARALDMLSNPIFAQHMKELGINVADANGNFRPMVDVVADLKKKFDGLSPEQRATALAALGKGAGGTIQAMRFLNLAVTDTNGLLPELTNGIQNSSGAADKAYAIMKETPAAQIQDLKNRWQILRVEIGDKVLPIVGSLAKEGKKLIDWFENLSPKTQDMIVKIILFGSVIAIVAGAVIAFVGILLIFAGAIMSAFSVALPVALGIMALIPVVLALIGVAIYEIITHWDEFSAKLQEVGINVQSLAQLMTDTWNGLLTIASQVWNGIKDTISQLLDIISQLVQKVSSDITAWWQQNGADMIAKVTELWNILYTNTATIFGSIGEAIGHVLNVIMMLIGGAVAFIEYLWQEFGDNLLRILKAVWDMITEVIRGALNVIFGIIHLIIDVINGDWGKAWDDIKQIVDGAWDAIFGVLRGAARIVGDLIGTVVEAIMSPLRSLWDKLFEFGSNIVDGLIHGIDSMIGKLEKKVGDMVDGIMKPLSFFKFGSPSKLMIQHGQWIGEGLANGIDRSSRLVSDASAYLASQALPDLSMGSYGSGNGAGSSQSGPVVNIHPGAVVVTVGSQAQVAETQAAMDTSLAKLAEELRVRN